MAGVIEETWRVSQRAHRSFTDYLLFERHAFAYREALRRCSSGRVAADIACGNGYALDEVARVFSHVVALDLARGPLQAISVSSRIERVQCDAGRLPLASSSIDMVVAFQLIEHVDRGRALAILREVRRVLRPGGLGFVTTPNRRWRLLPGQRPWNPYHVIEYGPSSIAALCRDAGLGRQSIAGVVGLQGAQEIERARVRQDPVRVIGGRLGARWRQMFPRRRRPIREVDESDRERGGPWFALTDDFARGLDFWIEIRGDGHLA